MTGPEQEQEIAAIKHIGNIAYKNGEYAKALWCAQQLRTRGIWNPENAFNAAQCLHILGRTKEAIEIMEQLCNVFPANIDYVSYLSGCLMVIDDLEKLSQK
jgi:hypothetical protein